MKAAIACALISLSGAALAQDPPHWFTPPPPAKSGATVDLTTHGDVDQVVVIAKRRDRSWRSTTPEHLNDPLASDAARPRENFSNARPYCNSTMRTVGGQPGRAGDMMTGPGAGGC